MEKAQDALSFIVEKQKFDRVVKAIINMRNITLP